MSKKVRQNKIIEIISTNEIDTQEELAQMLNSSGFDVTQATVSRDVKELGLIKINGINRINFLKQASNKLTFAWPNAMKLC